MRQDGELNSVFIVVALLGIIRGFSLLPKYFIQLIPLHDGAADYIASEYIIEPHPAQAIAAILSNLTIIAMLILTLLRH